jgi:hypothetical protein
MHKQELEAEVVALETRMHDSERVATLRPLSHLPLFPKDIMTFC